ncbi:SsrA-binding protein SmpB [Ureaplasma canigenitalium]|uniref:SsrA-binding protein SmpB n=1 Tax=Ureaplasma canigenitalium TaxID=42092 RepID=UPI0004E23EC2|nr:SsrA-binding protein SmpB [Ureaplasma canigenitalium]
MIITNKNANRNYFVKEEYEAGMVLKGTEVKSVSHANCSINESFIKITKGEVYIINMHIAPFFEGNRFNQDPYRSRKLLLHRKEIIKISHKVMTDNLTLIPLKIYWKNNKLKMLIGLCQGKKLHDKREDLKKKTLSQEARFIKQY